MLKGQKNIEFRMYTSESMMAETSSDPR